MRCCEGCGTHVLDGIARAVAVELVVDDAVKR